jgi:hypothetical protein
MDQNDEFDQSQGNEGENDQFFHQEDQDNVKGDSKSSEILPMPSGFVTKIFVDPNVDPNVNLIKIMLQSNANFTDESETWLYESIFSFYSLLAFEALSMEYQRIATKDACMILATKFSDVMQTLHNRIYFQENFLNFLPNGVVPEHVLMKLSELSKGKLNKKFTTLSSQPSHAEEVKQIELRLANLGNKVCYLEIK